MEPDDELMACPYDKNHLIHPLRMPYHLLKCRKNFPDIQLAVCPYSAMHEVPPMELQLHMANCPSKRLVEGVDQPHALAQALCGKELSIHKGCTDIPPMTTVSFDDDDENWDEQIGENQGQPLPVYTTHHRRRAQEANNLRSLRSNVSADLLVRRPKSHSVAQKMNSGVDSDSSLNHATKNGRFEDYESEDYHSDSVSQSYLFGQGDRSSRYTTDRTTASALHISKDIPHGKSIILPEKEGEIQIGTRTTSDIRQRLRGRGSLLEYLPDRPERRPGQQYSLMITAGRGRFTGNIPLKP